MTSSNGNIFRLTGPLCGEFTGPGEFPTQRPVARSFDVFCDLRLNKRLCKQSWGWWFETLLCPLWCRSNAGAVKYGHDINRQLLIWQQRKIGKIGDWKKLVWVTPTPQLFITSEVYEYVVRVCVLFPTVSQKASRFTRIWITRPSAETDVTVWIKFITMTS